MSDKNKTPETEKILDTEIDAPYAGNTMFDMLKEHARKMEIQRDEARELAQTIERNVNKWKYQDVMEALNDIMESPTLRDRGSFMSGFLAARRVENE